MIFGNIFRTYSVRHYATADRNKVVLGMKVGVLDEIKLTFSIKKFRQILQQLNEIDQAIGNNNESSKNTK